MAPPPGPTIPARFKTWVTLIARVDKPDQRRIAEQFEAEAVRLGAPFTCEDVLDDLPSSAVPVMVFAVEPRFTGVVCKAYKIRPDDLPLSIFACGDVSGRRARIGTGDAVHCFIAVAAEMLKAGVELPQDVLERIAENIPARPSA